MRTEDFDYDLDESRIAQSPLDKRDESKLLVLGKKSGDIKHDHFFNIGKYLKEGDLLVLNDTKVIPARLFGSRPGKEEKIEVFLVKRMDKDKWECLVRPGKKMKMGQKIGFSDLLQGEVVDITEDGSRIIEFKYEGIFEEVLDQLGEMPLPPYIKEKLEDSERYQTVYAKNAGSAAAPTAGLHFTEDLLESIRDLGVEEVFVTLHVGIGTFRPVSAETIEDHHMHSEEYEISEEVAKKINQAKRDGRRIIAVGTTSCRTLEAASQDGQVRAGRRSTDIFIYPGYDFKTVDGLITNFHLPKSTLLMLVSALSTKENIIKAYQEAVDHDYRFFSFGDAMFIS